MQWDSQRRAFLVFGQPEEQFKAAIPWVLNILPVYFESPYMNNKGVCVLWVCVCMKEDMCEWMYRKVCVWS